MLMDCYKNQCAKCLSPVEKVESAGVEIERCTQCGALHFDVLEHEDLRALKAGKHLDAGDIGTGLQSNDVRDLFCPKTGGKFSHMRDLRSGVDYEMCPSCHLVVFDAGELTRYVDSTRLTWVKNALRDL